MRHSAIKLSSHFRNPSPQDLSSNSILPHESRTFDPNIAVHTVISNQNGSVTELSRVQQQQQQQQSNQSVASFKTAKSSPQRGDDPEGSSYLDLPLYTHTHGYSIQNDSIPSEVNIIQDPPTPPLAMNSLPNDLDGSIVSLNFTNKSTTKKIDNIIEEINEPDTMNNEQNERENGMSVVIGNGTLDGVYHLNLGHVLQLNNLPTTYNLRVRKKINTLVKVTSDINYIVNYANDHIKTAYLVHIFKEEVFNTLSLSLIPVSAIASQISASVTINVANPTPTLSEERDLPSMEGSVISKNSEAVSFMELLKVAQEAQKETNDINTKSLHALMDSISKMNNAAKVDKSFKRITTKMLLEQKYTDFSAILDSRTQSSLSTWFETITRILKTSPWDINSTSLLEIDLPPNLSKASEVYRIRSMELYLIVTKLLQVAECQGTLDQLDSQVSPNDGVSLLYAAKEAIYLVPHCKSWMFFLILVREFK